jgi:glycosyltransferase involved in cell wall biosynthesis
VTGAAPLVSVGIPSYNHGRFLAEAIESVLGQTLPDVELVIADDGSTDDSVEIARRYADAHPDRVTVLTHPGGAHRGLGPTVNLYRPRLRGTYILGLASDDVLYPDTLEREVELLEARPEVGFVYGLADRIDASGAQLPGERAFGADVTASGRAVELLVQGNKIPSMTAMIRRACLERVGPEDEDLVYGDWAFYTRLTAHYDAAFIPRTLAAQRIHGANTSAVVSRETNLERAVAVTRSLRERAERIGGRLLEPRVRATLELQWAFLGFATGERRDAAEGVSAALERDRTLAADGGWLADWLWNRLLDGLAPPGGASFALWFADGALPLLSSGAARVLAREVTAAAAAERAAADRAAGRPAAPLRALPGLARAPRRLTDRRVAAMLLDPLAGGRALRGYLRVRRALARHR